MRISSWTHWEPSTTAATNSTAGTMVWMEKIIGEPHAGQPAVKPRTARLKNEYDNGVYKKTLRSRTS